MNQNRRTFFGALMGAVACIPVIGRLAPVQAKPLARSKVTMIQPKITQEQRRKLIAEIRECYRGLAQSNG